MNLTDIPHTLIGGTLVEYKANCGFSLEYGRATITSMGVDGTTFYIRTDNEEAFLEQNISEEVQRMGYAAEVRKRGDVYLISSPMGWCYAVAPKGGEIPTRPNWLEVSDGHFEDALKKHLTGEGRAS